MKTSIKIYPNKWKKSSRNGKTPFYLRVVHNGLKSQARLNVSEINDDYLKKNGLKKHKDSVQRFQEKLRVLGCLITNFKHLKTSQMNFSILKQQ